MHSVIDQKVIAQKLLQSAQCTDPFAMIAGGAVRDWYFNKTARDLDLYMRMPLQNTSALVKRYIQFVLMGTNIRQLERNDPDHNYAALPDLKWVYEFEFEGMKVNLMVMEKGVDTEILANFDTSICRCYFDGRESHFTEDFLTTVRTRTIIIHDNYTGEEAHIRKLAKYYPQFCFAKIIKVEPTEELSVSFDQSAPSPVHSKPKDIPW